MKTSSGFSRRRFASLLAVAWSTKADSPNHLPAEKVEEFLAGAKVISSKPLNIGIARTQRLTLTDNSLTHDAHFQTIDLSARNFRDTYKYNIAAYRLDRILDLHMIPPSIERTIDEQRGALTWWIPGGLMEYDRLDRGIKPPDPAYFDSQMEQGRVFDQLIFNNDRNLQNLLLTPDGKVWLIDHTRAFRLHHSLRNTRDLVRCDSRLFAALQNLTEESLKSVMDQFLNAAEIDALLKRRDRIVEAFRRRAAKEGESKVFVNLPPRPAEYPIEMPGPPWPQ